jgi:mannose-6-phosphate isomerase-like protein (cupin superfamily)
MDASERSPSGREAATDDRGGNRSASPEPMIGRLTWPRPATFYEQFCNGEGIPVHRGLMGIDDVRRLELASWKRTGGRGAFIDLDGTGGVLGLYLAEVPAGRSLIAERHLYEEVFYVVEGRGTTETWIDGQETNPHLFEWQRNSVFAVPLNAWHQLTNPGESPALLLVATNAPPVFELFRDLDFVFDTPYHFTARYRPDDPTYFEASDDVGTDDVTGRALKSAAILPDVVNCELPFDGQRGSGHRRFGLELAGNVFKGFIAQYPPGRYSKTHAHESGPVLVCLDGGGYTLSWPKEAGTTPWLSGKGELVRRQDYGPGGIVSAAPGGADWFHGHYGTSARGLRVMAFLGGFPQRVMGAPGDPVVSMNRNVNEGGQTIEYRDEDPEIVRIFKSSLEPGVAFDMAGDFVSSER